MTDTTPAPKPRRRKPGPAPTACDVRAVRIGRCLGAILAEYSDDLPLSAANVLYLAINRNAEFAALAKLAKGIDDPTRKTAIHFYSTLGMEAKP